MEVRITERKCPCSRDCPDRNAHCHMKGKCPHGFDEWAEEHKEYKKQIEEAKQINVPHWTKAQETRHFNWVKYGQRNSKK